MTRTVYATYDGEVLRPDEPMPLAPNTRVLLTVESDVPAARHSGSFLAVAEELDLDGPPEWSARVDEYLYGQGDGAGS